MKINKNSNFTNMILNYLNFLFIICYVYIIFRKTIMYYTLVEIFSDCNCLNFHEILLIDT